MTDIDPVTDAAPASPAIAATRVLVADDQHLVRSGLRLLLDVQPGVEVVAEAADGVECVELARRLRPDVCLVDIRMPGLDGLEVTRLLAGPGVADPLRVVVVTTFDQDDYVHRALENGACGFLLKDASPALLIEAVRAARRGDALISPAVTVPLLRRLREGRPPSSPHTSRDTSPASSRDSSPSRRPSRVGLTGRELDVVRRVAIGRTNQEIGSELSLSLGTVKTHLAHIQSKLGVRNRVEIASWAWATGTVSQGSFSQGTDSHGSDSRGSGSRGSDSRGSDSRGSGSRGSGSRGSGSRGSDSRGSGSRGSDSRGSGSRGSGSGRTDRDPGPSV